MKFKVQSSKFKGSSKPQAQNAQPRTQGWSFLGNLSFELGASAAWLLIAFLIVGLPAAGQIVITSSPSGSIIINQGGGRLIIQGGIVIQGGQVISGTVDPQLLLMMSQPPIDTNQAVAIAEFDPPTVAAGTRTTYRIVITALEDMIELPEKLPAPAGLKLEAGGKGQGLQNLGGIIQARSTFNFRAQPAAPGTLVMPAFKANVNGRAVTIPEARLTVLPAGSPLPPVPRLTLEMPTNDIYIGQSVPARLVMNDTGDNAVLALTQAHVEGKGLLTERGISRMSRPVMTRDGRPMMPISTEVLVTPMREGPLVVVGQANVVLRTLDPNRYAAMPGYYPLIDTDPLTVTVRRVPKEGELPGYTGAIGSFVLEPLQLSANTVQAGDPVKLQVIIRGEGNFGRFTPPMPAPDPDWQVFPPTAEASPGSQAPGQGFAAFTYTLIPLSERVTSTPLIPFSVFDPERKAHKRHTIPPVNLTVTPASGVVARRVAEAPHMNPDDPGSDEKAPVMAGLMKESGASFGSLVPLQQRGWFLALQLAPAAMLAGLWLWDLRRRFLAAHPDLVRKRRGRRALVRERRRVRHALRASDANRFVTHAVRALRAAAAPHTAANPDALVARDVMRELPAGTNGTDAACVRRLFAAADAERITQRSEGLSVLELKADFERVAGKLEERLWT